MRSDPARVFLRRDAIEAFEPGVCVFDLVQLTTTTHLGRGGGPVDLATLSRENGSLVGAVPSRRGASDRDNGWLAVVVAR